MQLHSLLYLLIILAVSFAEISGKVNTDSGLKKIGLGFIFVGAVMEVAKVHNPLLPIGVLIYFGRNILVSYLNHKKRRANDNHPTAR